MDVWISAPVVTGLVVVTATATAALVFGGPLERRAAAWIWAAWLMTLLQALTGEFDPALLFTVVDATMLMVLSGLAWRSGRTWLKAAVAAQATCLAIDLLRLVAPVGGRAHLIALAVAAYALLLALAAGTWSSWRERRRIRLGISS